MEVRLPTSNSDASVHLILLATRYEMRRECQQILPGLLLGPFVASKNLQTLRSLNISHMYATLYVLVSANTDT